ncbi:MAG TPA: hypothetical protein VJB70_05065 [Candidatus Paceibacterota bacterium]
MIVGIEVSDITSPNNKRDIIIGMNTTLNDVRGIGLPFVKKIETLHPITLGAVLSFEFDDSRQVHMLICHDLGQYGWKNADHFVRFGMDFLWHTEPAREYSIVQIGTGRVGHRDRADPVAIRTAMTNSFLPVTLFVFNPEKSRVIHVALPELKPFRAWSPTHGVEDIRYAAQQRPK